MAIAFSLMLIAAGAILAFAVDYEAEGIDIQAAGIIVLVVGLVGLAISMALLVSFEPFTGRVHRVGRRRHPDHNDDQPPNEDV